jgi:hypothetical protein
MAQGKREGGKLAEPYHNKVIVTDKALNIQGAITQVEENTC